MPAQTEKIMAILAAYFPTDQVFVVDASTQSVPLIMATVRKATHSFSSGQRVYIYDVYGGMNERVQVIGRFRRHHRWIRGVCPIVSLENTRPTVVFHPSVIKKLSGKAWIRRALFEGFLVTPSDIVQGNERMSRISIGSLEELTNPDSRGAN